MAGKDRTNSETEDLRLRASDEFDAFLHGIKLGMELRETPSNDGVESGSLDRQIIERFKQWDAVYNYDVSDLEMCDSCGEQRASNREPVDDYAYVDLCVSCWVQRNNLDASDGR